MLAAQPLETAGLIGEELGQPVELGLRARQLRLEHVEPSLLSGDVVLDGADDRGRGRDLARQRARNALGARDLVLQVVDLGIDLLLLRAGVPGGGSHDQEQRGKQRQQRQCVQAHSREDRFASRPDDPASVRKTEIRSRGFRSRKHP